MENRLKGSPELVNVPSHLQSLTTSIASLGSGLEDMKTTTAHLQETQEAIKQIIQTLNKNVTGINVSRLSCYRDELYHVRSKMNETVGFIQLIAKISE